jgi:hypothetical protein
MNGLVKLTVAVLLAGLIELAVMSIRDELAGLAYSKTMLSLFLAHHWTALLSSQFLYAAFTFRTSVNYLPLTPP